MEERAKERGIGEPDEHEKLERLFLAVYEQRGETFNKQKALYTAELWERDWDLFRLLHNQSLIIMPDATPATGEKTRIGKTRAASLKEEREKAGKWVPKKRVRKKRGATATVDVDGCDGASTPASNSAKPLSPDMPPEEMVTIIQNARKIQVPKSSIVPLPTPRSPSGIVPQWPSLAAPSETGKEIPIPDAFVIEDFDVDEMRYLLAAYQWNNGARFKWRALPNDISISIHESNVRAAQLQMQGVVRIVTPDGQAEFTDPAKSFLRAMLSEGKAVDCIFWTTGQRMFILDAAFAAGPENTPFVHENIHAYQGNIIRRDLIQRGVFEATGPNNVKTKFTAAGLEQLCAAFRRREEAEYRMWDRPEIAVIDKHLEHLSRMKMIGVLGQQINKTMESWTNKTPNAENLSPERKPLTALDSSPVAKTAVADPHVAALNKIAEKLEYLKPADKEKFLSKRFSFKRVVEAFENLHKLVKALIAFAVLLLLLAGLYYGVGVPFILPKIKH